MKFRRAALAAVLCAGPLLTYSSADAAHWQFTPYVDADVIHTDNIFLAPSGGEEGAYVLRAVPGFELHGKGPRLTADMRYEFESYIYPDNSNSTQSFHALDASALATLVADNLYLVGTATAGQTIIDPRGRVPLSNVTGSTNRTDALTWKVNPYYEHRFGGDLNTHVGYTFGQVVYNRSTFEGVPVQGLNYQVIDASIGQQADRNPFAWSLIYDRHTVQYDQAPTFEYQVAGARTQYALGPEFALTARAGRESDVANNQTSAPLDSTFWAGGFIWHPSQQHELTASYGERFFGHTYEGGYKYSGRRLRVGAGYNEGPSTQGIDLFNRTVFGGNPDQSVPTFTPVTAEVFIGKNASAWAEITGKRNTIGLQGYVNRREYIAAHDNETERGATGNWTHLIGPRTRAYIAIKWQTLSYRSSPRDDYFTEYTLGVRRQIGRHLSVHGTLQRFKRATDDTSPSQLFLNSIENAVTLGLHYQF